MQSLPPATHDPYSPVEHLWPIQCTDGSTNSVKILIKEQLNPFFNAVSTVAEVVAKWFGPGWLTDWEAEFTEALLDFGLIGAGIAVLLKLAVRTVRNSIEIGTYRLVSTGFDEVSQGWSPAGTVLYAETS